MEEGEAEGGKGRRREGDGRGWGDKEKQQGFLIPPFLGQLLLSLCTGDSRSMVTHGGETNNAGFSINVHLWVRTGEFIS